MKRYEKLPLIWSDWGGLSVTHGLAEYTVDLYSSRWRARRCKNHIDSILIGEGYFNSIEAAKVACEADWQAMQVKGFREVQDL